MKTTYSIPIGEIVWTSYYNDRHDLMYVMTSKNTRDFYYLYEVTGGKLTKLGRSKSPIELEEKYDVVKNMFEEVSV